MTKSAFSSPKDLAVSPSRSRMGKKIFIENQFPLFIPKKYDDVLVLSGKELDFLVLEKPVPQQKWKLIYQFVRLRSKTIYDRWQRYVASMRR